MRYLIAAAVIFMLFVLPAGSWWYLKSGLEYRIQVRDETQAKSAFEEEASFLSDGAKRALLHELDNRISVVSFTYPLSTTQQDVKSRIVDKYGERDLFQFIEFTDIKGVDHEGQLNVNPDFPLYLVDQDLQIRNKYEWDDESIKQLVVHIAAVLPLPVRQTISLKRDLNESSN